MGHVIRVVANYFAVTEVDITKRVKGPQKENEARKLAMYFCQELVAAKLTDIAARFHLTNIASNSSKDLPLVSGKNLRMIISPIMAKPP